MLIDKTFYSQIRLGYDSDNSWSILVIVPFLRCLVFFLFFLISIAPGYVYSVRLTFFLALGILTLFLFFIYIKPFYRYNIINPLVDHRLSKYCRLSSIRRFTGISCMFMVVLLYGLSPKLGLSIHLSNSQSAVETDFYLESSTFEIIPTLFLPERINAYDTMTVTGVFFSAEPVKSILFYSGHGEAVWKIDGEECARNENDAANRYLLIEKQIDVGFHTIKCFLNYIPPIPTLSLSVKTASGLDFQAVPGPFSSCFSSLLFWLPTFRIILFALSLGSIFLFLPILDGFVLRFFSYIFKQWKFFLTLGWIASLFFLLFLHIYIQRLSLIQFESDEAAFGLMSYELLEGQCPPVFHYGQNYQGTLEAYPLAWILSWAPFPSAALRLLPWFWGLLFVVLTSTIFWIYGNAWYGLFSFWLFAVGGLHFHWIIGKTWFGYSFSLFCGALLFFLAFLARYKGRISPGLAIAWGLTAGLSFYELPISLPFVFSSGFILLFIRPYSFLPDFKMGEKRIVFFIRCLLGFVRSSLFLAFFICFLFCAPYWLPSFFGYKSEAIQFLTTGRSLPAPRVAGEQPLIDRFLSECLPVFLGQRAPYDQQHDLHSAFFPSAPTFIFLSGFLLFPFLRRFAPAGSLLRSRIPYYSIWILALTTILLTSFSFFGIWPWYALPLYFAAPFLLMQFFRFLWAFSPTLSFFTFFLYFMSILSSYFSYSFYFHQPASLSIDGVSIPTNFEKVFSILQEHRIRYLLCDQGFDVSPNVAGRDWLGEAVTYASQGRIIAIDSLDRRFPAKAQEIMKRVRVGYLYHLGYWYNNPSLDAQNDYSPLSIQNLNLLFGPDSIGYRRYDCPPYVLFLPSQDAINGRKNTWRIDSNVNWFLSSVNDHNLCVRTYGRDAYWSNDEVEKTGAYLAITLNKIKTVQKIILFLGTKISDFPRNNRVWGITALGEEEELGMLQFDEASRCSTLRLEAPMKLKEIKIVVPRDNEGHWWTIVEAWIL
ncbi:MAG: hypothetical protein AB1656_04155 [Candidatus Omnitrophota bacterium]